MARKLESDKGRKEGRKEGSPYLLYHTLCLHRAHGVKSYF